MEVAGLELLALALLEDDALQVLADVRRQDKVAETGSRVRSVEQGGELATRLCDRHRGARSRAAR